MTNTVPNTPDNRRFEPGELVNVTIRGARVDAFGALGNMKFPTLELGSATMPICMVNPQAPGVIIERAAPKEWPPQTGDIWLDRDGREWIGRATDVDRDLYHSLTFVDDGKAYDADTILDAHGPMRLDRRRGWTPQPSSTDEPEDPRPPSDAERRTELIAGLRELADLLENRPDLPVNLNGVLWSVDDLAALQLWAAELSTDIQSSPHKGDVHHAAEGKLRGLPVRVYRIERAAEAVSA